MRIKVTSEEVTSVFKIVRVPGEKIDETLETQPTAGLEDVKEEICTDTCNMKIRGCL